MTIPSTDDFFGSPKGEWFTHDPSDESVTFYLNNGRRIVVSKNDFGWNASYADGECLLDIVPERAGAMEFVRAHIRKAQLTTIPSPAQLAAEAQHRASYPDKPILRIGPKKEPPAVAEPTPAPVDPMALARQLDAMLAAERLDAMIRANVKGS